MFPLCPPLKGAIDASKPMVPVADASGDPFVILEPDVPTAVGEANHRAFISYAAALFFQVVFRFLQQLLNSLISHG